MVCLLTLVALRQKWRRGGGELCWWKWSESSLPGRCGPALGACWEVREDRKGGTMLRLATSHRRVKGAIWLLGIPFCQELSRALPALFSFKSQKSSRIISCSLEIYMNLWSRNTRHFVQAGSELGHAGRRGRCGGVRTQLPCFLTTSSNLGSPPVQTRSRYYCTVLCTVQENPVKNQCPAVADIALPSVYTLWRTNAQAWQTWRCNPLLVYEELLPQHGEHSTLIGV